MNDSETREEAMHDDLPALLAAWHGQTPLDEVECGRWIERLNADATLRRQFAGEIHLAGLTGSAQAGEPRWLRIEERLGCSGPVEGEPADFETVVMTRLRSRRPARPWLAAAAGVAVGLFAASMVWAITGPAEMVATASRLFALAEGSFEGMAGRVTRGFPVESGMWSGDRAEIVEAGGASDGGRMLRFVQAEREPALPSIGAASCDVYQIVDLLSLRADLERGEATLELSARFLDARDGAGDAVKFICRLYVFSGSPDSLQAEWPFTQKEALASGSGQVDSPGANPGVWREVSTRVLLPPQAEFAVVHLVAHRPGNPAGTEAAFGEQFADDVRLTLKTQPTLPVRLAQR